MKPMNKPPNYDTDPIAEICAPLSGGLNIRAAVSPQANNRFTTGPGAPERRSAYVEDQKTEKEKQMTPEKMRALQRQIEELNTELDKTAKRLADEIGHRAKAEADLKTARNALKKARARIKTLEG